MPTDHTDHGLLAAELGVPCWECGWLVYPAGSTVDPGSGPCPDCDRVYGDTVHVRCCADHPNT